MLDVDNEGTVWRSPGRIGDMMTVVVTAYAGFGLRVSEAKTEAMCLHAKAAGGVTCGVSAADQECKTDKRVPRGAIREDGDLGIKIKQCVRRVWSCLRRYGLEAYDLQSMPLGLKVLMLRGDIIEILMLRVCYTEP